jgi:hypothetical protein
MADTPDEPDRDPSAPPEDDEDAIPRRWLIRAIVGLGFGIPIAIEGATLVRMLRSYFFGGGGDDGDEGGNVTDPTAGIGDELLPGTSQSETITRAVLVTGQSVWEFEARIRVENTGDAPYTFRVDAITTDEGNRIADPASTGPIAPGESATIEHTWRLPVGQSPAVASVVGITDGATTDRVERDVELDEFPRQN